ncbi:hypothetical protein BKA63DRAFT_595919 [Paraphoma chrysanthemicola]|nr:hypothetical protein BKA63DRAFT_595919 [Paraphoma chrysanthemicola]
MAHDSIPATSNIELSDTVAHPSGRASCGGIQQSSDETSLLERDMKKPGSRFSQEEAVYHHRVLETKHSRATFVVIGSYLAAWSLAVIHCVFFKILDGKDVSSASVLQQSHVSTISLLLVTAFRAAIIVVLGSCFTQYLWFLLRARCLQLSLIDDLFQIRSNLLGLCNHKVFRQAPILFLVATLSWLVPLATIYPPGALTIQTELFVSTTMVNASILNPITNQSDVRSLADIERVSREGTPGYSLSSRYSQYVRPSAALDNLSKLLMFSGQSVTMPPLTGENSSYTLAFEGPRVQCRDLMMRNSTSLFQGDHVEVVFNGTWVYHGSFDDDGTSFERTYSRAVGYFPVPEKTIETCNNHGCSYSEVPLPDTTVTMIFENQVMRCDAYTALYQANIKYGRGLQQVTYTTGAEEKLQFRKFTQFEWNATDSGSTQPDDTQVYKDWAAKLPEWYHKANSQAILESVGLHLGYIWSRRFHPTFAGGAVGNYRLANGTVVNIGGVTEVSEGASYNILQDTVLNIDRFGSNISYGFDPRKSLSITEASINALLANVSFSALSLNTWYGNVAVNDTNFRNVYRFSNPLNFFLPYGLCLCLTLIFIAFGLNALRLNGTEATDGGFLQVMMTTTGNTSMSREVKGGSLGGRSNAPQALLDLKVRFGELINERDATSAKRYGFGTEEETVRLRRSGRD